MHNTRSGGKITGAPTCAASAASESPPASIPTPTRAAVTGGAPPRRRIRAFGPVLAVLVGAAVLVTACHSGGPNDPAGNPSSSSSGPRSQSPSGPAYAQCMRQHGVTNFPDPQGPNQNVFALTKDVVDNPHYQAANEACADLRPQSNGSGSNGGANQQKLLALAKCMRANGVPNFPDPSAGGAVKIGGPGLDPQSPTFQHAFQLCQAKLGLQLGGGS